MSAALSVVSRFVPSTWSVYRPGARPLNEIRPGRFGTTLMRRCTGLERVTVCDLPSADASSRANGTRAGTTSPPITTGLMPLAVTMRGYCRALAARSLTEPALDSAGAARRLLFVSTEEERPLLALSFAERAAGRGFAAAVGFDAGASACWLWPGMLGTSTFDDAGAEGLLEPQAARPRTAAGTSRQVAS